MAADERLYMEGVLLKRQRGLKTMSTKLKFQERYCRLTSTSLDYYDPKKKTKDGPKGQFDVKQICIVEDIAASHFCKDKDLGDCQFFFQVGDLAEVMYLGVQTAEEKSKWMEAFRKVAEDSHVTMLSHYHTGLFSMDHKGRWSCCGSKQRVCTGCTQASITKAVNTDPIPPSLAIPTPTGSPNIIKRQDDLTATLVPIKSTSTLEDSMKSGSPSLRAFRSHTQSTPLFNGKQKPRANTGIMPELENLADSNTQQQQQPEGAGGRPRMSESVSEERSASRSPSIADSGTASGNGSRPQSIIDSVFPEARPRTSSGKTSTLSVVSDQGVESDTNCQSPLIVNPKVSLPDSVPGSGTEVSQVAGGRSESEDTAEEAPPPHEDVSRDEASEPMVKITVIDDARLNTFREQFQRNKKSKSNLLHVASSTEPSKRRTKTFSVLLENSEYIGLHAACKDGDLEAVQQILRQDRSKLDELSPPPLALSPIFITFWHDYFKLFVYLLQCGANVTTATDPVNGSSLLHWSSKKNNLDVSELLVKHAANVNSRDNAERTPLMEACALGHLEMAELLLDRGADVRPFSSDGRTALHEAAQGGHHQVVELLVRKGADVMATDDSDSTPYDMAFRNNHVQVTEVLRAAYPPDLRPYLLRSKARLTSTSPTTSLCFITPATLAAGSTDCNVTLWNTEDMSLVRSLRVSDTVLALSSWNQYLCIGYTSIQLTDTETFEWKRTVADDTNDDENLESPPLHLVQLTSDGQIVSAGVESNVVKIWPTLTKDSSIYVKPLHSITVHEHCCVYSLSMSGNSASPHLAVGVQPGDLFALNKEHHKLVFVYNWQSHELTNIYDGGRGGLDVGIHTVFSPDGQYLVIACAENLCIWQPSSNTEQDLLYRSTLDQEVHFTAVCFSPDGMYLSAGLSNGDIQVFNIRTFSRAFSLRRPQLDSAVSSLVYSQDGKLMASGYQNGIIHLWEACSTSK